MNSFMRKSSLKWWGCFLVFLASEVTAQTRSEQHVKLRATLEQWMQSVDQSQDLENKWEIEKSVLADTIVGLRGMLEQAEVDIKTVEERLQTADQDSQEKIQQQTDFNEARDALRKGLLPVEAEVAKVVPLFPEFYIDESPKLKKSFESLAAHRQAEPDAKDKLGLNSRIQPLVQILTEAERFNSKLWAVTHPLKVGEVEKQMNVLYFGLSVAYAVDDEAKFALEGRNSPSGWTFVAMKGADIAIQVKTLYDAADGSGESQIVNLPLTID